MRKIRSPRVMVLLEQPGTDELLEIIVQTDNRDMVRFDRARVQRRWPTFKDASLLWMTFLAWSALKRAGQDGIGEYDEFEGRCVEIIGVDEHGNPTQNPEEAAGAAVDPTQTGLDPV